ncbi:hypothetical protein QUW15_11180 [Desulfovibrio piger]|nr:hypothetical protein [Desulfovibrio piger]
MSPAPVDVVREAPVPFALLDGIAHVTGTDLVGWRHFSEQPFWLALEAAAQAAALHQRWLTDFDAHAFLLSLGTCRWSEQPLTGRMELRARLLGQTAGAAAYDVQLSLPDTLALSLPVHVGLRPYDDTFRRDKLQERYRALFRQLYAHSVR